MSKEEKLKFLKQSFILIAGLGEEIRQTIEHAREGVKENNANLIIGGLVNIDQAAAHLKNIYEAMLFVHRN